MQKIENVLTKIKETEVEIEHECRFRGSALPYCQMDDFLSKLNEDCLPNYKRDLIVEFYFDVGTAIHTLVQRWFAPWLFGNWECTSCSVVTHLQQGPQTCPNCQSVMTYQELTLSVPGTSFSGHCDGVFIIDGKKYLLEAKSCTTVPSVNGIPLEYKMQTSAYHHVLSTYFNITLEPEVLFLYIPRVGFHKAEWVYYTPEYIDHFKDMLKKNKKLPELLASGEINKVVGICDSAKDGEGCPWVGICFSPQKDQLIKKMWDAK